MAYFVEERTYTLHAGATGEYLRQYSAEGLGVQQEILGDMVGYFTTEFGTLNQIVHMWGYQSLDQRQERRAALLADERWRAYVPKIRPLVVNQENRLLVPASFSPIGGAKEERSR